MDVPDGCSENQIFSYISNFDLSMGPWAATKKKEKN
jgi:hypothetical protein